MSSKRQVSEVEQLQNILGKSGLTPIQIAVYLHVLRNPGKTATKIAQSLEINRPNTYLILEKLVQKKLVNDGESATKRFYPTTSSAINALVEEQVEQVNSMKMQLDLISPMLESFFQINERFVPKIQVFEGVSGENSILEQILLKGKEVQKMRLLTNQHHERKFFSETRHYDFIARRMSSQCFASVLAVNNAEGRQLQLADHKSLRVTKLLPNSFSFTCEIYIFPMKIFMIDFTEKIMAVSIESNQIASIMMQTFDYLWQKIK